MKALVDEAKMRPAPAGGEERGLALEEDDVARLHLHGRHPEHRAVGVAHEVERHPLDEELRLREHVSLVQRVQHRVPGAVRGAAGALHRALAEILRMPAEGPLVDRAVVVAVEGHAEVLELDHHFRRHAAHELDRVLVAQPVRPLHRVVHVPVPAVLSHVAERSTHAALRRHGVRARREDLGQDRDPHARVGQLQRGAKARAAGPHDHRVELANGHRHVSGPRGWTRTTRGRSRAPFP